MCVPAAHTSTAVSVSLSSLQLIFCFLFGSARQAIGALSQLRQTRLQPQNKPSALCLRVYVCPLLLLAAVAGNYADFIAFRSEQKHSAAGSGGGSNSTDTGGSGSVIEHQWYTDYAKMSYSALMFYGYVFVLGLVLFFALRWFR